MKLEEFTKALEVGNYEIMQNQSCYCNSDWDIDRDGVLHYSASGDDCWVANELSIDNRPIISCFARGEMIVVDQELEREISCDIVNFLQDHGFDDVLREIDIDNDEINEEHEANVSEAFVDFVTREGYTVYAHHPRGFVNEYNLYFVAPGADTSEIPISAAEIDVDDVVAQYLTAANGAIMSSIGVICV